uniref:Uncharacterized protein n=1 Tax=Oryza nivara TaxID=4536 RepID=A0A0E0ISQ2_ORYNI
MRSAAGIWMAHGAGRATTGDLVGEGSGGKKIEIREAFQTPKLDGDVSCKVVAPETDDLEALTGCQCRRDLPTDGVAAEVEVLELREAPEL